MPLFDHDNVIEAGRETPAVRRLTNSYGWCNLKSDGGRDVRQLGAARRECRLAPHLPLGPGRWSSKD